MKVVGSMLVILVLIAVGWRYINAGSSTKRPQSIPGVVVYTVTKAPFQQKLEALGTTRAIASIDLTSAVTERVVALPMQEGTVAKQGTVLVELQADEEKAQLQAARVELQEQQREYARIEDLVRKKTIPSSELDQRQSLIDLAQAKLAEAQANLDERILRAPFTGTLGFRNVSIGALARPGDLLTTLDAIHYLETDFSLAEKYLNQVHKGKQLTATSIAYPGESFTGTVTTIASRVDPVSRSVSVRATLDNPERKLQPGMLVQLSLIMEERESILLPEEAVFMRGLQHYVYVIDADNIANEQAITIGERRRGQVEIINGLQAGQRIVHQGLLKVRPGKPVRLQEETWRSTEDV